MRIERTGTPGRAAPAKFARRRGDGFDALLARDAAAAEPIAAAALPETPPLVAEAVEREARDTAGRRHGHRMLDLLRDLQLATLRGPTAAACSALAAAAAAAPEAADDRLAAVLTELRVRAAVEQAKQDIATTG